MFALSLTYSPHPTRGGTAKAEAYIQIPNIENAAPLNVKGLLLNGLAIIK